jgi:hypothetical protein
LHGVTSKSVVGESAVWEATQPELVALLFP